MNAKFEIGDLVRFTHEVKSGADVLIRRIINDNTLGVIVGVATSVRLSENKITIKKYNQYEVLFGDKKLPIEEESLILVSRVDKP